MFVDPAFVSTSAGPQLTIDGDQGHHLARVLRVQAGEPVSLADGSGMVWQAEVREVERDRVVLAVGESFDIPSPSPRLAVAQGMPKGRRFDEAVQRLTEVGVDRLRPVVTDRTVKDVAGKAGRLAQRWAAVELAAAQQCRRAERMVIDEVVPWPVPDAIGVVLWEEADLPLRDALVGLRNVDELTIAVGPEGGLTAEEVDRSGLVPCRLGPTILRTETAGLVAAAVVSELLGRWS